MERSFGVFLKEKRQEQKLTQKALAELLFVTESAVSKWEKNVARPDISLLPKLSELLGVSEHELITASIDTDAREEKRQAKKWRTLSTTWEWFFYIAYVLAIIPCFICNLAIQKTLSWFWIVLSALVLSFTFTNLPRFIKKHKLLFIPLSMYLALCVLLGVCAVYTHGDWFWVAALSVLLGLVTIFAPIYICKYSIFSKVKRYADFLSVAVVFILLTILLIVIDCYTVANWYLRIALPISLVAYLIVNLFLCVRFLKINRLFKTSVILLMTVFFLYIVPLFIRTDNAYVQRELDDINIFNADFSVWRVETIECNVHAIVCLSLLAFAVVFFLFGLWRRKTKR